MNRRHTITVVVIAIVAALLLPASAEARPSKFRGCPSVKQAGTTYLLYKDAAIVTKTTTKKVTIPYAIHHKGKRYLVRAVWEGALSRNGKLRKVDLRADLECCEDDSLFIRDSRNIRITVHTRIDYKWLTEKGNTSKVTLKK